MIKMKNYLIFSKNRRSYVLELFPLKEVYSRRNPWHNKHRNEPKGFVEDFSIDDEEHSGQWSVISGEKVFMNSGFRNFCGNLRVQREIIGMFTGH
jgi:hypothetical protein